MKSEFQSTIYEFGEFRVDAAKRLLLRRGGEPVPLTPKVFDTLLYLLRHSGTVIDKDELMREIWADTIVEENNLNKNISTLRHILGERPGEHRFIATVPGKGYKFVCEVIEIDHTEKAEDGSALAGGLNPDKLQISDYQFPDKDQKPKTEDRLRNFKITLLAALVLLVAATSAVYFWRQTSTKPSIKTIAVLPFKPLVAENRDEALEVGMADNLIARLGNNQEIVVRPLSSVRRYGNLEQDALIAGRALDVDSVLDGNIQRWGDSIRVNVSLVRVADGTLLWRGTFDEKLTDIFAVQDSISERVVTALKVRLGSTEKKRDTKNVEAYELYMKGRYHALKLTRAETDKGIKYFQQAIGIDPNYALAYIGLAEAYLPMALTSGVPSWEAMPKAKVAALRAIEIDETLAEAHATLGWIIFWYDWDWQASEKQYLRALELNPNSAEGRFFYAHLLSNTGRHEQALAEIKLSRELDPLSLRTNALEGQILFFAGKYDEALDRLQKTIDLDPNFWLSHLFISRVYSEKGMHAEAVAAAKKAGELSGNSQSNAYRAYALAKAGKTDEARAVLDELFKLSAERYVPPYNFAIVHNAIGESDKALNYLEKGYEQKDVRMVFLKVEPKWNNLRSEPRFLDLVKRMRLE
jgi:DNA-binding winged helix-turn-helix (wHTH) protein/TolB-like protein/Tfp pilus assembly protein PilF